MALTIALDGYGEVVTTTGASTTNWAVSGSGGISVAANQETFLTNNSSVGVQVSGNKEAWLYFDQGASDRALDFSVGGTEEGQCLYIWFNIGGQAGLDPIATPGVAIRIGSGTGVYRTFTLGGADSFANEYVGGWQCAVIDPTKTGSIADSGAYNPNNITFIGVFGSGNLNYRVENILVDSIQCAAGISVTGVETTSGEGWQEVIDFCNDFQTGGTGGRAYGAVQERDGVAFVYGNVTVGGTVATTFTNTSRTIKYGSFDYWNGTIFVTSMSDGFHGLTVTDNGTAVTQFADGIEVGTTGVGRSGSSYIGSDDNTTVFSLRGTTATSYTSFYNTTFNNITGTITGSSNWGDSVNDELYSCTFAGCGQFSPIGTVPIRNCFFTETASTAGSILWTSGIDIQECSFIANSLGAGVEIATDHGADGEESFIDLAFSGNTFDVNNTTGAALNVNLTGTSNPTTSTGSAVTFVASYLLTLSGIASNTQVTIVESSTRNELQNTLSTGADITYTHGGAGTTIDVLLISLDTDPNLSDVFDFDLLNQAQQLIFDQQTERNYANP